MNLNLPFCVAGDMTAHVDRYRQTCDVSRCLLDVYCKTGLRAAKALRTYSQTVYLLQYLKFKVGVQLLGIALAHRSAKRLFGKICTLLEIATDAYAYHDGRTWI